MKKLLLGLGICIALFLCLSCADDNRPQQEWLVANLEIRYLQPERHLRAQAQFSRGDSSNLKPYTFPTVQYNEKSMELKRLNPKIPRYQSEQYSDYQLKHNFRLIDIDNREQQFELSMSPIDSFYINGIIDPSLPLDISWTGQALKENESLVLLFTDEDNKASSQTIQGPTPKSAASLKAQQLTKLSPGVGQLYLVKKQIHFESSENVQLSALIEYYTNPIAIEVKNK